MNTELKILILDDDKQFTEELADFLKNTGFVVFEADTAHKGLKIMEGNFIDLLIIDISLPGINGLDFLKKVNLKYPGTEVIVVSAQDKMETVVTALRSGAIDFLRKPFKMMEISIAIERSRKFLDLRRKLEQSENERSLISKSLERSIERNLIGISLQIREVLDLAMSAAEYADINVLITGETGTGKENIARIIHFASSRKDHLFCAVNSGSINDSLMESEFFGHKKGSFTGAISDRKGFFEISDKGTLFLDEIADMPLNLQTKMLRAIEEKKITPVGETKAKQTDFRVISATHHDLSELVEQQKFRLDLFYRLNALHIHIPPLRERVDDIEPLLLFFAREFSSRMNRPVPAIDPKVIELLRLYKFPGNVRELKNLTERAIMLSKGKSLNVVDFPVKTGSKASSLPKSAVSVYLHRPENMTGKKEVSTTGSRLESDELKSLKLKDQEEVMIRQALEKCRYNRTAAAAELGIQRMALVRKMKKYNIIPPQ